MHKNKTLVLSLGALGIVYGDLGTSPLYALQQVLNHSLMTREHVFGVLSLVFWSLILVISTCYVSVFLSANNDGEGGVLALLALLKRQSVKLPNWLFLMGIIGAGLLIGDGMITPAISVLSAVEGLNVIAPEVSNLVLVISFSILVMLFFSQKFGSGRISFVFGPIIFIWFITIAALGISAIYHYPAILAAINPYYAYMFMRDGGWHAYLMLGGIFLVITGAEAMYADLAHFGKNPIRIGWFCVALPALLLNYFGQGANVLNHPEAIANLFYSLAPKWFEYPLLILATLATIIASQAVISASFSLARQAVLLEICPRLSIKHTSTEETGQVYVPQINYMLAFGTLMLVIIFKNSAGLTAAFGMAVNLVMLIVAVLVLFVARIVWQWSYVKITSIFAPLMVIDLIFLGSNMHKISEGAWIPLVFAMSVSFIMLTWQKGIQLLRTSVYKKNIPLQDIIRQLDSLKLQQLESLIMIFIVDPYDNSGGGFLHYIKLNHVLPKHTLILRVIIADVPYVADSRSFELIDLAEGFHQLTLHYGFMQVVNIPKKLHMCASKNIFPFIFDVNQLTFIVQTINISLLKNRYSLLYNFQKKFFSFLVKNSELDSDFFHLPPNQTISTGGLISL